MSSNSLQFESSWRVFADAGSRPKHDDMMLIGQFQNITVWCIR